MVCAGVVTRLAGGGSAGGVASGSVDGVGSAARFYGPRGVSVDSVGNVYVAEYTNNLIRTISPTGTGFLCSGFCANCIEDCICLGITIYFIVMIQILVPKIK